MRLCVRILATFVAICAWLVFAGAMGVLDNDRNRKP